MTIFALKGGVVALLEGKAAQFALPAPIPEAKSALQTQESSDSAIPVMVSHLPKTQSKVAYIPPDSPKASSPKNSSDNAKPSLKAAEDLQSRSSLHELKAINLQQESQAESIAENLDAKKSALESKSSSQNPNVALQQNPSYASTEKLSSQAVSHDNSTAQNHTQAAHEVKPDTVPTDSKVQHTSLNVTADTTMPENTAQLASPIDKRENIIDQVDHSNASAATKNLDRNAKGASPSLESPEASSIDEENPHRQEDTLDSRTTQNRNFKPVQTQAELRGDQKDMQSAQNTDLLENSQGKQTSDLLEANEFHGSTTGDSSQQNGDEFSKSDSPKAITSQYIEKAPIAMPPQQSEARDQSKVEDVSNSRHDSSISSSSDNR